VASSHGRIRFILVRMSIVPFVFHFYMISCCTAFLYFVHIVIRESVSDCCLTSTQQFVQLYHGEIKLISNEMMMRSALYMQKS
jgi:hypothetical protein